MDYKDKVLYWTRNHWVKSKGRRERRTQVPNMEKSSVVKSRQTCEDPKGDRKEITRSHTVWLIRLETRDMKRKEEIKAQLFLLSSWEWTRVHFPRNAVDHKVISGTRMLRLLRLSLGESTTGSWGKWSPFGEQSTNTGIARLRVPLDPWPLKCLPNFASHKLRSKVGRGILAQHYLSDVCTRPKESMLNVTNVRTRAHTCI